MGPFPHDAPPPLIISADNPMGTDGFEFVEFAHPEPARCDGLFKLMGSPPVARHRSKDVTLYRQGDVNYLVNGGARHPRGSFAARHGPCAPSWPSAWSTHARAYERALSLGAKPADAPAGAHGAQHAGHRGHRRQPDLFRRPLRRQGFDL